MAKRLRKFGYSTPDVCGVEVYGLNTEESLGIHSNSSLLSYQKGMDRGRSYVLCLARNGRYGRLCFGSVRSCFGVQHVLSEEPITKFAAVT